jgi:hypothetical protein
MSLVLHVVNIVIISKAVIGNVILRIVVVSPWQVVKQFYKYRPRAEILKTSYDNLTIS